MFYYHHPESDSLWAQDTKLLYHDGLVEELTETEYKQLKGQTNMQIGNFDATNVPPKQGGGGHPPANGVPFVITNTYGQETKDKNGCMLCVQFTSQLGSIVNRYNIFNNSEAAVKIAKEQLSALCHATGVFVLSIVDGNNQMLPYDQWARELRNARGVMDVGFQEGSDKYTELKKVYDAAGNEPGKGPASAPQPQPQAQGGGWSQPQQAPAAQAQAAPQPAPNGQGGGWQQGPATQAAPQQQAPQGGWQPGPAAQATGPGTSAPPWATPK